MEIGKLPADLLEKIILNPINANGFKRKDVAVRPQTGEDCSAVNFGGKLCVISTDPITGANNDLGYISVHINCNDIAAAGGEPIGITLTLLLPPSAEQADIEKIFDGAYKAANETGIEILGGHTEVTDAVVRPVISAAVIGKAPVGGFISSSGAKTGDDVIMTKWAGLEGASIIATDYERRLIGKVSEKTIKTAQNFKSFLSVMPEAKIAVSVGVSAMHDITEGGALGAAWEIADCSGKGVEIYADKIPIKKETLEICSVAGVDPYRLISSGCMLITTSKGEELIAKLAAAGIEAAIIGKIKDKGKTLEQNGKTTELTPPQKDELYNAFSS